MSFRSKPWVQNASLIVLSVLFSLFVAELLLRHLFPFSTFGVGREFASFRNGAAHIPRYYTPDKELGFRPVLDNDYYSSSGVVTGASIYSRRQDSTEILFIGDSVTKRARILRAIYGSLENENLTFLNGGVESYNAQQEIDFFFRYQRGLPVKTIVQTLHVNDLQATPIAFLDSDGKLNVYALNATRNIISPALYRSSHLYRLFVGSMLPRVSLSDLASETKLSLKKMALYAKENGINYYVLIFPILAPEKNWSEQERDSHAMLVQMCADMDLKFLDLLPVSKQMLLEGVDSRESKGDPWHPNDAFALRAAMRIRTELPKFPL